MTTTSESLLFRLQQLEESPDEAAWEKFVSLYTPLIFYWARKTGLEQNAAADLVQDVGSAWAVTVLARWFAYKLPSL